MNRSYLSFLDNVKVADVEATSRPGVKKQRNPSPAFLGFRIWANGEIYPSRAMVDKFKLEYQKADLEDRGTGVDVIDTRKSAQITGGNFIAVAFSPKDSPKVDLFNFTRNDENGKPLSSVMDQGSATFGKESLLPMIKELYSVEPGEEGFIDMEIMVEEAGGKNLRSSNGVEHLPKIITRGPDKGKPDYVRRENVDIYMICPAEPPVAETSLEDSTEAKANGNGNGAQLFVEASAVPA